MIDVIGRLSAAAARHELRDDDRLAGEILSQEGNRRLRPQRAGATRLSSLDQDDGFPLEIGRGLSQQRSTSDHYGKNCKGTERQFSCHFCLSEKIGVVVHYHPGGLSQGRQQDGGGSFREGSLTLALARNHPPPRLVHLSIARRSFFDGRPGKSNSGGCSN